MSKSKVTASARTLRLIAGVPLQKRIIPHTQKTMLANTQSRKSADNGAELFALVYPM